MNAMRQIADGMRKQSNLPPAGCFVHYQEYAAVYIEDEDYAYVPRAGNLIILFGIKEQDTVYPND